MPLATILCLVAGVIAAYLIGSANFAIIITRLMAKEDIRDHGSGNAGLTNVLRSMGKLPALLTLVGDFSKGIISVLLIRILLYYFAGVDGFVPADYYVCYAALLGHVYPIYYGFRGGKGILVSFGAIMILSPFAGIICFSFFLLLVFLTRYVSLGSIIAAVLFPISIGYLNFLSAAPNYFEVLLAVPIAAMILFLHRANIKRLLNKTENKISFKKKDV